jgi:DNA-binding MarR family transcriptional regulator
MEQSMSHQQAAVEADERRADVAEVADTFVSLMRSFVRARTRFLAAAAHDVDWAAHIVLKTLATAGPMRASDLAGCIQSDPSTVSRQVAALVKEGLVERQADPADGRASLLALTPRAASVIAEHDEVRLRHFADMLEDWSERDLRRFSSLLRRFTATFDSANEKWITERFGMRTVSETEHS